LFSVRENRNRSVGATASSLQCMVYSVSSAGGRKHRLNMNRASTGISGMRSKRRRRFAGLVVSGRFDLRPPGGATNRPSDGPTSSEGHLRTDRLSTSATARKRFRRRVSRAAELSPRRTGNVHCPTLPPPGGDGSMTTVGIGQPGGQTKESDGPATDRRLK
jgi:hypothetical protein